MCHQTDHLSIVITILIFLDIWNLPITFMIFFVFWEVFAIWDFLVLLLTIFLIILNFNQLPAWLGKAESGEEREKEEKDDQFRFHLFMWQLNTLSLLTLNCLQKCPVANYVLIHQQKYLRHCRLVQQYGQQPGRHFMCRLIEENFVNNIYLFVSSNRLHFQYKLHRKSIF